MQAAGTLRVAAVPNAAPSPVCGAMTALEIAELAKESAEREGLTPELLRAIIGKESSFRPCAVSPKGAMGLMQLMPDTARDLGVTDPFNPRQNMEAGSRFLRSLLNRYGEDLVLALGAYNAGPSQVDRYQGLPPFVETVDYVKDVMGKLHATEH
jgi:soluble lytic murein transglycosylase-like protein